MAVFLSIIKRSFYFRESGMNSILYRISPQLKSAAFVRPSPPCSLSLIRRRKSDSAAESQSDDVVVEYLDGDKSGIVVLGLNRPKAKNSFSQNLVRLMSDAIEEFKFDKNCRTLIIKSTSPGIFCAGADLKERRAMPPNKVAPFVAKARSYCNFFILFNC